MVRVIVCVTVNSPSSSVTSIGKAPYSTDSSDKSSIYRAPSENWTKVACFMSTITVTVSPLGSNVSGI